MSASRTRLLVLAGAAAVCGGLAANSVAQREAELDARVGPLVPLIVARTDIPARKLINTRNVERLLAQRRVPAKFAPPSVIRSQQQAIGYRTSSGLVAGDYVTSTDLEAEDQDEAGERGRGRLIQVEVAGGRGVLEEVEPGTLVDVLITSERSGQSRSYLALQSAQLVGAASSSESSSDSQTRQGSDTVVTLRVSLRSAILLTAAQNFAREIRLVPRAAGDRRVLSPVSVTAADLSQ